MRKCYFVQFVIIRSGKNDIHSCVFIDFDLLEISVTIEQLIKNKILLKIHHELGINKIDLTEIEIKNIVVLL